MVLPRQPAFIINFKSRLTVRQPLSTLSYLRRYTLGASSFSFGLPLPSLPLVRCFTMVLLALSPYTDSPFFLYHSFSPGPPHTTKVCTTHSTSLWPPSVSAPTLLLTFSERNGLATVCKKRKKERRAREREMTASGGLYTFN